METVVLYFLKASALIGMYFLAYHLLLRKETFFTTNRWFLLAGLFTSVLMPLFFIKKVIWIEKPQTSLNEIVQYAESGTITNAETFPLDWNQIMVACYAIVVVFLLVQIAINLFSLFKLLKNKQIIKRDQFTLVDLNEDIAPFSFFNYIVFNSNYYTNDELRSILLHEKIHSQEKHSIDVMIAKLFCIAFWFNPFMWLYKKAMIQNLEYIADQKACQQIEDRKIYQKALLKVVTHQNCLSITNQFYQSLIKKRIVMLNKNQSHKKNSWKYTIVLPVLVAFFIAFQIKVIAQEKPGLLPDGSSISSSTQERTEIIWTKNSSDEEMKKDAALIKKVGVNIKFSKLKRNTKGEITGIKVEFKDKNGKKGITHIAGDEPIKPIYFQKTDNYVGFGKLKHDKIVRIHEKHKNDDQDFSFSFSDDDNDVISEEEMDIVEFEIPEIPEIRNGANTPKAPELPKIIKKNIIIKKNGKDGQPEVYINRKKLDMPLADLEKMDKDFNGKFEFKSGDNDPFLFKFNDEEIMNFSSADIEKIRKEALESSRIHMEKMKEHMEKMKENMRENMNWQEKNRDNDMEKAREEMLRAKEEMLRAREEMKKAREEMEKAKSELKTRKA